jgi:hypothetical protein
LLRSVDLKTLSGPVLYTNILGLWPFLFFAYIGGEYSSFFTNVMLGETVVSTAGVVFLLLSSAVGVGIGYSGWWCRDKVSATSFTLIGVINKCLTVLLNSVVWDQHAGAAGIASLFLCLVGGVFYQQSPLRQNHPAGSSSTNGGSATPIKSVTDDDAEENHTDLTLRNEKEKSNESLEMEPLFERKRSTV